MTIEERAEQYAIKKVGALNGFGAKQHIENYVKIATEQKELDIQRACEWLKDNVDYYLDKEDAVLNIDTYIDAMVTDFEQAMKGEEK